VAKDVVKLSWRERLRGTTAIEGKKGWSWGGWIPLIRESFGGAWQRNIVVDQSTITANWAVFACVTLIANDIAKMPARVMQLDEAQGIWKPIIKRRVLDIPNNFQVWTDFVRSWIFSLLLTGNTYVLRVLDADGFVTALYVLDPRSVRPVVTPRGDIYYQVAADNLSGLEEPVTVPASQIIHDRINTLWHPLCGVSPLYASGVAAAQGLAMQENSAKFFQNMSRPGGILTAPGHISDEAAARLKTYWDDNFGGDSAGKIAVAGDGLKYEPLSMTAADSQLIEQLKFTGEMICATFHVPPYKLGIGTPPSVGNIAALNQQYYDQCLFPLVEVIERRLDIGLDIKFPEQVWFDTEELLRMDPNSRWESYGKGVTAGVLAPNEGRRKENLVPVEGGDTPYLQQQNFSLADLSRRSDREKAKGTEGDQNVQSQVLNGGQVTSLLSLLTSVTDGSIPVAALGPALKVSFPNLSEAQIEAITKPLRDFEAPEQEPGAAPAPSSSTEPAEDDPEEDPPEATDEELSAMSEMIKGLVEAAA
jgi:HK97 family phage portal protein